MRPGTMRRQRFMFKHYLLALSIAAGLGLGCKTGKNKKPGENYALINIYLEQNNDGTKFSKRVSVYRADPDIFYVNSKPFLDTADLERVSLMNVIGGFALQFQFNRHGTAVLESYTTSSKGKRMAIFCQFTDSRVLAAPMITARKTTGILRFTPDCTREEAEKIVNGLTTAIKEIEKNN